MDENGSGSNQGSNQFVCFGVEQHDVCLFVDWESKIRQLQASGHSSSTLSEEQKQLLEKDDDIVGAGELMK